MQNITRKLDPRFIKYKQWCNAFNMTGYTVLNCLNPSTDLAWLKNKTNIESSCNKYDWMSKLSMPNSHSIPSSGIRNSILSILTYLKDINPDMVACIPSDVYVVYQQIVKNIMQYKTYNALGDISSWRKDFAKLTMPTVLLIASPMSPSGKYLTRAQLDLIERFLSKPNNWVIVDAAYNYSVGNQPALSNPRIFWCTSLSKTYLSPMQGGAISINDSKIAAELKYYVESATDNASSIIYNNLYLAAKQQLLFDARWAALHRQYPSIITDVPENGYLCTVPIDFDTLLRDKIIGVPADIFGDGSSAHDKTVLSCLNYNEPTHSYYYFTTLNNFASSYDKYSRTYTKNDTYTYPSKFYLCSADNLDAGITKAKSLLTKTKIDSNEIIAIQSYQPVITMDKGFPTVNTSEIYVDNISIVKDTILQRATVEDIYSSSLLINRPLLYSWSELVPRTVSVLPISIGCQAKCPFCFSKGSISADQPNGNCNRLIDNIIKKAHRHNVNRAVITGGGEPTMLSHDKLVDLVSKFKCFTTVVLITNGYCYAIMTELERTQKLMELKAAGLTVLSISRHGCSLDQNSNIMHLRIESELTAKSAINVGLQVRWVCVIQKQGVHDIKSLEQYLDWVITTGVNQICFKELYVSTSNESVYHDTRSNEYSRKNQVSLSLLLNYAKTNNWTLISTLPWGSPIYKGLYKGYTIQVAIYTEPSVYWERHNGICRSWNIMSDGTCYASLEDKSSVIDFNTD